MQDFFFERGNEHFIEGRGEQMSINIYATSHIFDRRSHYFSCVY